MRYPVTVFGVKDVTRSFVEYLNENVCRVDLVVTIDDSETERSVVSGYGAMDSLSRFGTELYKTSSYSLKGESDEEFFSKNEFGIAISMNWSRLIPESVLNRFESGVFGLHGSSGYLPFGQGRATLNWSLIKNDRRFVMHMFKLDAGVDSPDIYSRETFEVNEFDDIRTLQYKDLLASERLASRLLGDYLAGKPIVTALQSSDPQFVYPGRKPEDGRMDTLARTDELYNLVRAVTRPFPGAFAFAGGERVTVWRTRPFERILDFSQYRPGEIVAVFDGRPLMRTVDGSLLIDEYECARALKQGDVLE